MTNVSNASGFLTIFADRKDVIEAMVKMLDKVASQVPHRTLLGGHFDKTQIRDNPFMRENHPSKGIPYSYPTSFSGDGDYTYENSLQNFFGEMIPKIEKNQNLMKLLEDNDFLLLFNFADEDRYEEILYSEVCTVEHKAGDSLEDSAYHEVRSEDYDYTAKNLVLLGLYKEDDVWDGRSPSFFGKWAEASSLRGKREQEAIQIFSRLPEAKQQNVMSDLCSLCPVEDTVHFEIEFLEEASETMVAKYIEDHILRKKEKSSKNSYVFPLTVSLKKIASLNVEAKNEEEAMRVATKLLESPQGKDAIGGINNPIWLSMFARKTEKGYTVKVIAKGTFKKLIFAKSESDAKQAMGVFLKQKFKDTLLEWELI